MRHGDNQGNRGLLEAGSVQWMTAGRGIVHSEMPEQQDGLMWGFQLWVNLPARDKLCPPRYQDIPPAAIPRIVRTSGAEVRVIAGTLDAISGPVSAVAAAPIYLDYSLAPSQRDTLTLARTHNAFVYCYRGRVTLGADDPTVVDERTLAVLGPGDELTLAAAGEGARALVIGGRPFGEPIARYGPFVMNTRDELMQAVEDLRAGRF